MWPPRLQWHMLADQQLVLLRAALSSSQAADLRDWFQTSLDPLYLSNGTCTLDSFVCCHPVQVC